MVLGKLTVPGRPTIWSSVGQGPTALAVGAGGGCLDIFILICSFSPLSPSLWETARYRLKYCLKGPLNPKQTKNKFMFLLTCISHIHVKRLFPVNCYMYKDYTYHPAKNIRRFTVKLSGNQLPVHFPLFFYGRP